MDARAEPAHDGSRITSAPLAGDAAGTAVSANATDGLSLPEDRPEGKIANSSIRLNIDTLDHLMTMVSELVLTRNQLMEIVRRYQDSEFSAPLQRLSNITAELQESVLKTRMQPVGNAWQKLPRIVRDLSAELESRSTSKCGGGDRARPAGAGNNQGPADAHGAQRCGSWDRDAAAASRGKPERGPIRLLRLARGRPHPGRNLR